MNIKPILMNTEMVRAILDGRKTVTRRVVKGLPTCEPHATIDEDRLWIEDEDGEFHPAEAYSPYQPGDILYVRETWTKLYYVDPDGYTHYDQPMYYYAADSTPDITLYDENGFEKDDQRIKWRPSIHMPKEAARIFLRVTDVRVERLQGMTMADAEAEGAETDDWLNLCEEAGVVGLPTCTLREYFGHHIWDRTINGLDNMARYGWGANPWVWVIEFERCEKPEVE